MGDWFQPITSADEKYLSDAGFRWGQRGTHTSRTIMIDELQTNYNRARQAAITNEITEIVSAADAVQ